MAWDASFKNFLKRFIDADIATEIDVPTANLRLDFQIKNTGKLPSPFSFAKQTILGEFKSERDSFAVNDIYKGLAKTYLHIATSDMENAVTLLFVIGGKNIPPQVTDRFQLTQLKPGIALIQHHIHTIIVELDHMEYDDRNMFLGIFAAKPIRKQVIAKALREKESFITSYSYFLYKDEVVEVAEAENIEIDPRALSIRAAVESIGLARVIEEVGLARVIEEVGLARVIEEVGPAKIVEEIGIEALVSQLTTEQKKQIAKMLTPQENK